MNFSDFDREMMREALLEAHATSISGDVPIGCVIVHDGRIIGRGRNRVEKRQIATAHAELEAIENAVRNTGYKHLLDSTMYVSLEPCSMCSGAIVLTRIERLVFAAFDPKAGASGSLYQITEDDRLNHRCVVEGGLLADESSQLLKNFFRKIRQRNAK